MYKVGYADLNGVSTWIFIAGPGQSQVGHTLVVVNKSR